MTGNYSDYFHKRLNRINNQLIFMDISYQKIIASDPKSFTEHPAERDIGAIIKDIAFLERSVSYHLELFLNGISEGLDYIKLTAQESSNRISIPLPINIADKISFEFEAYVISFQKLLEQPTPQIIKNALGKGLSKDFPSDDINRKNIDGLYWRINLLRNRSAHPGKPKYLNKSGRAHQYLGFSSRCLPAEITDGSLKIQCTLFDLNENKWMNDIIKNEIIDAPIGAKRELTDILLPDTSPKGYGKNKPQLLMYGGQLKPFDYIGSFPNLANSTLDYIERVNHLLLRRLIARNEDILNINIRTNQKNSLSILQLFSIE